MHSLSRREMLSDSSSLLVSPIFASLSKMPMFKQSDTAPIAVKDKLSKKMQDYAVRDLPSFVAKVRTNSASPQDYKRLSAKLHLLANHFSSVDTEPLRSAVISPANALPTIDFSTYGADFYSSLVQENAGITQSEFSSFSTFSSEQLEFGRELLAKKPISEHIHVLADMFKTAGQNGGFQTAMTSAPQSMEFDFNRHRSLYSDGVYDPGLKLHKHEICFFCHHTAAWWCAFIAALLALGLALAAIAGGVALGAAAAAAAAASLGMSVANLLALLYALSAVFAFVSAVCGIS